MSLSSVTICSNALVLVGDATISDFDEDNDRARRAKALWPVVSDYVLRRHPWNCAIKRAVLSPEEGAPEFDYLYRFTLPGDCLRVLSVGMEGERPRYKVEGRALLMDSNVCKLRYVFRNEDVTSWDAMLVWGMTQAMRAAFAYSITQSGTLEQAIEAGLRDTLKQARAVDGQEDTNDGLDDSPLIDARYIGWGR